MKLFTSLHSLESLHEVRWCAVAEQSALKNDTRTCTACACQADTPDECLRIKTRALKKKKRLFTLSETSSRYQIQNTGGFRPRPPKCDPFLRKLRGSQVQVHSRLKTSVIT